MNQNLNKGVSKTKELSRATRKVIQSDYVLKSKRPDWFLEIWKPQIKNKSVDSEGKEVIEYYCSDDGYPYTGVSWYDEIRTYCENWADGHSGCKWAFAYHEKGHNMDEYPHEECEHIHLVLTQDNPCYGTAVKKHFPGSHIEKVNYKVENCGQYLLHLSASAKRLGKPVIPFSDLYCSGKGEHGQIWFPLISSVEFETFVSSECIHLVYNEHMTTMIQFISRFGGSVCHGSYNSTIKECIAMYRDREYSLDNCHEIFELMNSEQQRWFLSCLADREFSSNEILDFWVVAERRDSNSRKFLFELQQLYVWLHCTTRPANYELMTIIEHYDIQELKKVQAERVEVESRVKSNSIYYENKTEDLPI